MLRSLDAIHLAAAFIIGPGRATIFTYDERLAQAAESNGFRVLAPR
jgi:predicted nucleic acid-binding protein